MFTFINTKNFKSLKNVKIDFNRTKTKTNKIIAIYGANGSGKTNITELFEFLKLSMYSRIFVRALNNHASIDEEKFIENNIYGGFLKLEEYRTIDEEEPTEIEYGFKINNNISIKGSYYLKFNNKIIEERLETIINGRKKTIFNLCQKENNIEKKFEDNMVKDAKYADELKDEIDKYWGKVSFLSILNYEMAEKNFEYIKKNISPVLLEVIFSFSSLNITVKRNQKKVLKEIITRNDDIDITHGQINKKKELILDKNEKMLNAFFQAAYSNIKELKYKRTYDDNTINYELFFYKRFGNKVIQIPYNEESSGTQNILNEFNSLVGALGGDVVIADEIDNGIHDLLMAKIIESIKDKIGNQFIFTTHNTYLLNILPKDTIYIISTNDDDSNKSIKSIKSYKEVRVQKNNSKQKMYLSGKFKGIPIFKSKDINFTEIKNILQKK